MTLYFCRSRLGDCSIMFHLLQHSTYPFNATFFVRQHKASTVQLLELHWDPQSIEVRCEVQCFGAYLSMVPSQKIQDCGERFRKHRSRRAWAHCRKIIVETSTGAPEKLAKKVVKGSWHPIEAVNCCCGPKRQYIASENEPPIPCTSIQWHWTIEIQEIWQAVCMLGISQAYGPTNCHSWPSGGPQLGTLTHHPCPSLQRL